MIEVELPKEYGLVLVAYVTLSFQCLCTGFANGRGKFFDKEGMEVIEKKFGDDHKEAFGETAKFGDHGYPD